jgi:hypoxanthine phosphoribosyltransferase
VRSYDYANRTGVEEISWDAFAALAARLAELVEPVQPEVILGVARAGLFPATAVACALRRELSPVRITRRLNDEVRFASPVWRTPVPADVAGRRVVVIDEMADSGETLRLVADAARTAGAASVTTAALVAHSWAAPAPDAVALVTDAFVVFPWDARVLIAGRWQPHPEIVAGRTAQPGAGDTAASATSEGW